MGKFKKKKVRYYGIEFNYMNKAKFTYMMLQCSYWSCKYCLLCGCECKRGEEFDKNKCKKITDDNYRKYKKRLNKGGP